MVYTMKSATIFYIASEKFAEGFIASTTRPLCNVEAYFRIKSPNDARPSYLAKLCDELGEDPELYFNKIKQVEFATKRELNEIKKSLGITFDCINATDRSKSIYSLKRANPARAYHKAQTFYNDNREAIDLDLLKRGLIVKDLSAAKFIHEINKAKCRMNYRRNMEQQSVDKKAETLAKRQEYYRQHRERIIKVNRIKEITQDIRFYLF